MSEVGKFKILGLREQGMILPLAVRPPARGARHDAGGALRRRQLAVLRGPEVARGAQHHSGGQLARGVAPAVAAK
eukprot:8514046-Pyramimonas_sp.AAC.1